MNYFSGMSDDERNPFVNEATVSLQRAGKSLTDIAIFIEAYRLAESQHGELPTRSRNGIGGNYGLTQMPFGKFKGTPLSELDDWYIYWLAEQGYKDPLRSALDAELERRDSKKRRRKQTPAAAVAA